MSEPGEFTKPPESSPIPADEPINILDRAESVEAYRRTHYPNIHRLTEYPNKLVRIDTRSGELGPGGLKQFELGAQLYAELRDVYGIAVPKFSLKVGTYQGQPAVFTIVDEVIGEQLNAKQLPEMLSVDDYESLCASLIRYLGDKLHSKQPLIDDAFRLDQYIFGHTANDPVDRVYFVDLEPWITQSHMTEGRFLGFENLIEKLTNDMLSESLFEKNPALQNQLFQELGNILRSIPKDDPLRENLPHVAPWVSDEE